MKPALDEATISAVFASLPAEAPVRAPQVQPVHVVYGGAHRFRYDTATRLGSLAIEAMLRDGGSPREFAAVVGVRPEHADVVWERTLQKLRSTPIEDLRIDFEDGFGPRPDAEEDVHAARAASEVARGLTAGTLPPRIGVRPKGLGPRTRWRAARTLDRFLGHLLDAAGRLPDGFVVTLPKPTSEEEIRAMCDLLSVLEVHHGLREGALRLEWMIEAPGAVLGEDGRSPMVRWVAAANGRCAGLHLGAYDLTAAAGVLGPDQALHHALCDRVRAELALVAAITGVFVSDGATTQLPIGPHPGARPGTPEADANAAAVCSGWALHAIAVRSAIAAGIPQGWDLHPAQLPARHAVNIGFFVEHLAEMQRRMGNFLREAATATQVGGAFDDAATGLGLLAFFRRGRATGALTDADLAGAGLAGKDLEITDFGAWMGAS